MEKIIMQLEQIAARSCYVGGVFLRHILLAVIIAVRLCS